MNTNIERGVHSLEIAGEKRLFRIDLNGLVALESMGINLAEMKEDSTNQLGTMRALLWVGFRSFNHDLTIDEVGSWIDMDNMPMVSEFLTVVFEKMQEKK